MTWAKDCDKYFFIARLESTNETNRTLESFDQVPLLQPADYKTESYNHLTDKMYRSIKYIYTKYDDYDWYLKADDDTFIFIDNLRKFVEFKNESDAVSFGFDLKPLSRVDNVSYHSGGAGNYTFK